MDEYYVYKWAYPDGVPFYIGKGIHNRIKHEPNPKAKIVIHDIMMLGYEVIEDTVYEKLSETTAFELEKQLIELYAPTMLLTNLVHNDYGWSNRSHRHHIRSLSQDNTQTTPGWPTEKEIYGLYLPGETRQYW